MINPSFWHVQPLISVGKQLIKKREIEKVIDLLPEYLVPLKTEQLVGGVVSEAECGNAARLYTLCRRSSKAEWCSQLLRQPPADPDESTTFFYHFFAGHEVWQEYASQIHFSERMRYTLNFSWCIFIIACHICP